MPALNPHAMVRALALALTLTSGAAQAVTLYDPGLGTLPPAQGWTPLSVGSAPAQTVVSGRLRTDTLTDPTVTQFVDFRSPGALLPLDTVAGFTLAFDLKVVAEAHQSVNRAGYQLLVQGLDQAQALELCFWSDEVWALAYMPGGADSGFVHGNGALLDTTAAFRSYALTVQNNAYTLRVDGNAVLSGSMTDYPVLGLSTFVYGTSNTLYFGDDSTRGQAITELGLVSVSAVPEPASAWLLLGGLAVLLRRR
jgi:hypothetical protein